MTRLPRCWALAAALLVAPLASAGERDADAPALLAAAARTLGARKPAGAAEVLLDYLPNAPGEGVVDEVCGALAAVALSGGKPDPALLKALDDKLPARRAAAAVALVRAGAREQ